MAYKFLRKDNMSSIRDLSQIKSAKYFDENDQPAAIENGTIVDIGDLITGEREVHKVTAVTSSSKYVGIVSTPELEYDERGYHGVDTFINEAGAIIRVDVLHVGDIFTLGNVSATTDIAAGANLVAEHQATETIGRYAGQVYEVKPV